MRSEVKYNTHKNRTVVDVSLTHGRMMDGTVYLSYKIIGQDKWLRMYLTEPEAMAISDALRTLIMGMGDKAIL